MQFYLLDQWMMNSTPRSHHSELNFEPTFMFYALFMNGAKGKKKTKKRNLLFIKINDNYWLFIPMYFYVYSHIFLYR